MPSFTLAMGQMLVEGGALERNLGRAESMIAEAARLGCRGIVLPECLDAGWLSPDARALARPVPGPTVARLAASATRAGITVVAGVTELDGTRVFNTAVMIGEDGSLIAKHRKINELVMGQATYSLGSALGVSPSALGDVGLAVCADLLPGSASIGHALGHMRAQLILSPTAWAVLPSHDQAATP